MTTVTARELVIPVQGEPVPDLPAHIRRNIDVQPDGCWLWTRSRSRDGYGWASLGNKTYQAHRLVYKLLIGDPGTRLVLDHLCRVRHCVNPAHLQPVTNAVNLLRSPLTPSGQTRCLRCGGELVVVGVKVRNRRCVPCRRKHQSAYQRARRAARRSAS